MALVGLTKRQPLCKICNCFSDEVLNEITADLLLATKTYEEIKEIYNPLLPECVEPLNASNLNTHKRHSDPTLIAEEWLKRKGEPVTDSDFAAILYAQRFKNRIDKQDVLHALYKARINTLQFLRDLLEDKKKDYEDARKAYLADKKDISKKNTAYKYEAEVRHILADLDKIESDIQSTVLQDIKVEKGPGHTFINQNIVNLIEGDLKKFLNEFIPYLLYEVFKDDLETGKAVVSKLSASMDSCLSPSLKKLNQFNGEVRN